MTARTILVTHSLPYANGPLHIGHLLGYIQSDIWVRARRMAGDTVHYVAGDDVHGTPIMLAAEKAGLAPEEFIKGMQVSHENDFRDFGVHHDFYYTTHSPENRELSELVYRRLRDTRPVSHITTRFVRQFYDPVKQMFLPDRYIKGVCPNCGTPDQYGDNCENCGATYAPTDLKNPYSVVSGVAPELRDSEHYFFKLADFADFLRRWLDGEVTSAAVAHSSVVAKLKEWLDADGGLRDWDISRDAPYFGFPIPDAPGKFFYVWLDAPIGYLASFKKYCASEKGAAIGLTPAYFDDFMRGESDSSSGTQASAIAREMHQFLGKDIINFHGLFWPAMLRGAKLRTPNRLYVNGYLTVNGAKMSKSRGTFIQARTYLDAGLNPEYLRYYFATMLDDSMKDVDLDLKAFEERVNSHLVGKFVNIASRCAGFIERHFDGHLAARLDSVSSASGIPGHGVRSGQQIVDEARARAGQVAAAYAACDFALVARIVMELCDAANGYIAEHAPWQISKQILLAKEAGAADAEIHEREDRLHQVATTAINLFRIATVYLKPIIPAMAERAEKFLGVAPLKWADAGTLLLNCKINRFEPLAARVDPKHIESMIESSKESLAAAPSRPSPALKAEVAPPARASGATPESRVSNPGSISIDDFARLDLRIGKVLACEFVDGSDKLLRFELDAGALGKRQVFSGIRASYAEPAKLVGRSVVFIANLAPRKMRFGVSEGMILSAGDDSGLFLLDVDAGATPGMAVK